MSKYKQQLKDGLNFSNFLKVNDVNNISFEVLKSKLQYYDPIEDTDSLGTRQGNFLSMHDNQRNTFGFLNAKTQLQEILKIEEVEIRPL